MAAVTSVRASTAADLDAVVSCAAVEPVSGVDAERYRRELATGSYRPEWTWVALDGDDVVARAVWWGKPGASSPTALDCLWTAAGLADRAGVAAELLRAGHAVLECTPDLEADVAPGWREDPAAAAAVGWRQDAATRAGLTHTLERLSFAWTPEQGVPAASSWLAFAAEPDDEVVLTVLQGVAEGSLDDLTVRTVAALGPRGQAQDDLDFYAGLPGERSWWRLARTPDGELVGLVIPSRSAYHASVSYLGVLPAHRGHGYVDDLLAEITRQHAGRGAPRITGTTDTTNAPMAAAFARGGYALTGVRLVLSAPV